MITIVIVITNIIIIMIIIIFRSAESQNEESALFVSFSPPRSPFSILISVLNSARVAKYYTLCFAERKSTQCHIVQAKML